MTDKYNDKKANQRKERDREKTKAQKERLKNRNTDRIK